MVGEDRTSVFVSSASADRRFVERQLLPLLRQNSIRPWYARDKIRSAEIWERSIRKGLKSSDWFLVVLSPHAIQSEWVEAEVQWAIRHRQGRIVPVLIGECDPADLNLQLIRIQHIDCRLDWSAASASLLSVWRTKAQGVQLEVHVAGPGSNEVRQSQNLLIKDFATIGRAKDCSIVLEDERLYVSSVHATLRVRRFNGRTSLWIYNQGTNGTFVNGELAEDACEIVPSDQISIGDATITVISVSPTIQS